MKVVLAANGSRGDVQPMLVLAVALRERGHDVLLCGTPSFASAATEMGIPFQPGGLDLQQVFQEEKDIHANTLKLFIRSWQLSHDELRSQFRALAEVADGADLIVSGGSQFSGGSIAERLGVPHAVIGYVPLAFRSAHHPPTLITRQGLPGWANRAAWAGYDLAARAMVGRTINTARAALGMPAIHHVYREAFAPQHRVIAADPELCPMADDQRAHCVQTAAILPADADGLPAELDGFLRAGPPPVYLGFGSMVARDAAELTRTLRDAIAATGVRAVIAKGWAELGGVALPASCFAIGATSHRALFPRMAAIVHHGGAGTVATAARAGVPQIVVPHIADQFYLGHRVHALGLGPAPIPRGQLTAARLIPALQRAVAGEAPRQAARALAGLLARRDGATTTAIALEQLVARDRPRARQRAGR